MVGARMKSLATRGVLAAMLPLLLTHPARAAAIDGEGDFGARGSRPSTKAWTRETEYGDRSFRLSGMRTRSARSFDPYSPVPNDRLKAWSLVAHYDFDLGSGSHVGLFGTGLAERRRPAGFLTGGKALGAWTMATGLEWADDDRVRLEAGIVASGHSGARRGVDRLLELAAGAPIDASGFRIGGDILAWLPLPARPAGTALNFDMRLQKVSAADAMLVSGQVDRTDRRIVFTLGQSF